MVGALINKVIGSKNLRELRRMAPLTRKINEIEASYHSLSDGELRSMVSDWRARLAQVGDESELPKHLDELLPEAFAAAKNAARRLCGRTVHVGGRGIEWQMVHFDVQIAGGIALHRGKIAEMATGEGKTLVATLPLFLNALAGKGAHLITANDYLAKRDSEWVGEIFRFLGLTVGAIQNQQSPAERREQYLCDITYGTSSEFGFDYLRDNGMAHRPEERVQRGHFFAVVDEVDSILIDEARTPLIISGPGEDEGAHYRTLSNPVSELVRRQVIECGRLAEEAAELAGRGDHAGAGRALLKLRMGAPRSKGFLRAMENPELRLLLDKAELSHHQEGGREELVALKEELYYAIDEKQGEADLTEKGRVFLSPGDPDAFLLPDLAGELAEIEADPKAGDEERARRREARSAAYSEKAARIHGISQLLKAHCLHEKDVDYVVEDGKVVIVDQFTGRKMPGRRWSDGLHQAVEAKEGVQIERETRTLATITVQNYFRLYERLSGMTGTASTEANEFHDIYGLDVVTIPTNKKVSREDRDDKIFKSRREKYRAVTEEIARRHATGQPVLVGTASVEASEVLSRMLRREGIAHSVLNAKFHSQEADIISRAGLRGAVTISTNMAGRGTDIRLGDGVVELGGLHVIGTERHESRRIDRQLRGRCARQGDPGSSQFFVSFEDDLMRNFGGYGRMGKIMERLGMEEGEELVHPWLSKSVEGAQKKVEQRNYLIRKRTLDFDDVMNQQRAVIYGYRREIIDSEDPAELAMDAVRRCTKRRAEQLGSEGDGDTEEARKAFTEWVRHNFPVGGGDDILDPESAAEKIAGSLGPFFSSIGLDAPAEILRWGLLHPVDKLWQEHLLSMEGLREGVHLRSLGQKDPLVEYKREAYQMFSDLMERIEDETATGLFRIRTVEPSQVPGSGHGGVPPGKPGAKREADIIDLLVAKPAGKTGRNAPCPCGRGRKFKSCCGKLVA